MSSDFFDSNIQSSTIAGTSDWAIIETFGSTELLSEKQNTYVKSNNINNQALTNQKGNKIKIKQGSFHCVAAERKQKDNKLALRHNNGKKIQVWDFDNNWQLIKKNKAFKTSSQKLHTYETFFSQSLLPQSSLIEDKPVDKSTGFSWAANEPYYQHQIGLFNQGKTSGSKEGADIGADDFFRTISEPLQYTSRQADGRGTVAIIDTGVNLIHEDLKNTIKLNSGEVINGLDDDANGLIDDLMGYDFANDDSDPMDDHGHGSHVAGIAAAEANQVGILGTNPEARILAIKVMDSNGNGTTANVVRGIDYAVERGAKILNLSLATTFDDPALKLAMEVAASKGTLHVIAAGNEGINIDQRPTYPASYDLPNIISVGASDIDDSIAPFSNRGARSVDLLAPGSNIYSNWAGEVSIIRSSNGTSMAAPFVAGAISSFWSRHPEFSAAEVKQRLLSSVDNLGYQNQILTGGRMNMASLHATATSSTASIASETTSAPITPPDPLLEGDLNEDKHQIGDEVILFLKGRRSARKKAASRLTNLIENNTGLLADVEDIDVMTALKSRMAIVDFQDLLQSDRKVAILKNLFDRDLIGGFQFDQPINLV